MARTRNIQLAAVIREVGWSQDQVASYVRRLAAENDAEELLVVTRSHVSQWVLGSRPSGRAPRILCEALSRGLRRTITPAEIGLAPVDAETSAVPEWSADTVTALVDLGGVDMDANRRQILAQSAYSLAGAALPPDSWWEDRRRSAGARPSVSKRTVTSADVEGVREMMTFFSQRDQRRGGQAGRSALIAYLRTEVAGYVSGCFPNERVRCDLISAAAELVYLAGWTAFDASEQALAQGYFTVAARMAAEADDAPLAGHILRAMAHQAVDLGLPGRALELATGSMERRRYALASSREKALLGVVHARSLAAAGRKREALAALLRAEDDLSNANSGSGPAEPGRVWFFAEASLAHETACTLRDLGNLKAAEQEFQRSVRTRRAQPFARTHAVTLGYLGQVQARSGQLEVACATWNQALDAMGGVQSGRARQTVVQMRRELSPFRTRGGSPAADLDERARTVLRHVV